LLAAWVARRGVEGGPLFLPVQKDGVVVSRRLTEGAIYKILERRARVAGVPHFSPHDCRRTFIGDLLRRCGHEYRQGACRAREH
jgi:integrase